MWLMGRQKHSKNSDTINWTKQLIIFDILLLNCRLAAETNKMNTNKTAS